MPMSVYLRALEWVRFYVRKGTQTELNLAGIGETFLVPDLVERVRLAREAAGPNVAIVWATNGTHVTKELADALKQYTPRLWVSFHNVMIARKACKILSDAGLLVGVSLDPSLNANDWAGFVKEENVTGVRGVSFPCPWMGKGRAFVTWEGKILTCCLDASGESQIGHVDDPIGMVKTQPWRACKQCHQVIEEPGWIQKEGRFE